MIASLMRAVDSSPQRSSGPLTLYPCPLPASRQRVDGHGDQQHEARDRRTSCPSSGPSSPSPLSIDAMTSAPSTADLMCPRPPNSDVPPMTAAAIEYRRIWPPPALGVDRAQARGQDDAAERRHRRADREHDDLDPVHVDARAPRRLGVAADRVDVAAERRPVEHEGPEQEEHREHDEHVRDAAVLVRDGHDDRADQRAGPRRAARSARPARSAARPCPRATCAETSTAGVHRRRRRAARSTTSPAQEVVGEADDDVVLQRDRAAVADQQQHDAVPGEQAGQRHDERRYPDLRDEQAVQRRRSPRPASDRDDDRRDGADLVAVGEQQQRASDAGHAADVADRQVDLPQQQDEDDAHADRRVGRGLDDQVDEVPRRQEVRSFWRLEDDRDDDQADDDRQRAEVAAADALPPAAGVRRRRRPAGAAPTARRARSRGLGGAVLMRPPPRSGRAPSRACRR